LIILPYPRRRAEIITFVKKHHYTRRSPGVWTVAYGIENKRGLLQAVIMCGPPPYPSIARAFCRDPLHTPHLIWQTRMVGAGVTRAQLNDLLLFAAHDLTERGYWWQTTLTDPTSRCVDGALLRLTQRGYTGEVYARNGWHYLGVSGGKNLQGFLIDGTSIHIRQGKTTLTFSNVRDHYPDAKVIRPLHGGAKSRWAQVFGNEQERAQRVLLMKYHVQPPELMTQPRLLTRRCKEVFA